jgi:hypothetical protein
MYWILLVDAGHEKTRVEAGRKVTLKLMLVTRPSSGEPDSREMQGTPLRPLGSRH